LEYLHILIQYKNCTLNIRKEEAVASKRKRPVGRTADGHEFSLTEKVTSMMRLPTSCSTR